MTGSHLFGSSVCRVIGLWEPRLLLGLRPWTLVGDLRSFCDPCWLGIMSSGMGLPAVSAGWSDLGGREPTTWNFQGV